MTSAAPRLEVHQLTRRYPGGGQAAVNGISFALQDGEILALVGPSGCGKTTTLRLIAGLERPDGGKIHINGRIIAAPGLFTPPEQRGLGMIFQDHALFPHLNVFDNVAFGLRCRNRAEARPVVSEMLKLVGLAHYAGRFPHALSGGERQRVALARALAPRPVLVLMDEPFSSLDADLRGEVREQVRAILKRMRTTTIFVTHDQEEALFMGDRLAVMQNGQLEQIGSPEQIFHASATRFVAEFMGDSDFLRGEVSAAGILTEAGLLDQQLSLPPGALVEVAMRADDVAFQAQPDGNAVIIERFFRGAFNVYRLRLDSGRVLHAFKPHDELLPVGERVLARLNPGHPLTVFQDERAVA
jgi:iron(III) transport system ATP-binding protein